VGEDGRVKVTLLLCDAAQVADGKLHLLGGGWSFTGPGPVPSALAVLIEVPWDRANQPLTLNIELRHADGSVVMQQGPVGEQPVRINADIEVGRPPGHPPGVPLVVPLAINIPPMQLTPGARYSWEADIEGEPANDDWHVSFTVRSLPPASGGVAGIRLPGQ
jgi:hypothetical protein